MSTYNNPSRILFIEDIMSDYIAIIKMLSFYGLNIESLRVETIEEMNKTLYSFKPNIVIYDNSTQRLDGKEVLRIHLEKNSDIPFIILTGLENENMAIDSLKAGATDYIIKEHIKRLPFAVNEALKHCFEKKAKSKTERELIKSEKRFRSLTENAKDLIFRYEFLPHQHFEYVSPSSVQITGFTPDEFYSNPDIIYQIVHPDDRGIIEIIGKEIGQLNKPISIRWCKKDNSIVYTELVSTYIFNHKGKLIAIEGTVRDITDRILTENSLREIEESYSTFLNSLSDIAFIKDEEFHYLMINKAGEDFFGKPQDQIIGKTDFDLLPHNVAHNCNLSDAKATEQRNIVVSIESFDEKIFETRKFPIKLKSNKMGIGGFVRDMTDWHRTQKQIEVSEKKYRSLVENSLVGVYTTNTNGEFIFVNKALCNILEFDSPTDLININVKNLYKHSDKREEFLNLLRTKNKIENYEVELKTKNNNEIVVLISAALLGRTINGMIMDITDRKRFELELQAKNYEIESQNEEYRVLNEELGIAKEKAEESDRLKTAFLQNLSHEIRTPMNGIVGFTQLLKEGTDSQEVNMLFLDLIEKSGKRLMNIINDLVDISKIETDQLSLNFQEFELNPTLNELLLIFNDSAAEKGIVLSFASSVTDKNIKMNTDKAKFFQVLYNLISNAIKFTNQGVVEFGYVLVENEVEFFVKDTGIGIKLEYYDVIFEHFRQGDTSISRGYEGAGLGLPISKAFIEKLGGTLWVESEYGKGSVFKFSLPFTIPYSKHN